MGSSSFSVSFSVFGQVVRLGEVELAAIVTCAMVVLAGCVVLWLISRMEQQPQRPTGVGLSEPVKMVLVVRDDLKMGKGKIAAQCAHAAVQCFEISQTRAPWAIQQWKRTSGTAKICLKCGSEDELFELARRAKAAGVVHALIADAGRTQVEAGTHTVCGFGPAPVRWLDPITGQLGLL